MEPCRGLAAGKLIHRNPIVSGIEIFRETFLRLLSGDRLGRLILQV